MHCHDFRAVDVLGLHQEGLRGENQHFGPSDALCAPLTAVGFPNRVTEHVELQSPPETIWVVLKPFL